MTVGDKPGNYLVTAFEASWQGTQVELTWDIAADERIEGFKIYRSAGRRGREVVVNADGLLPPRARGYVDSDIPPDGRSYYYTLGVVSADGSEVLSRTTMVKTAARAFTLDQNHPNPFNPATTISFVLPATMPVVLSVYNAEGKLVTTLVDGILAGGYNEVEWAGTNAAGNAVGSGIYFCRLRAGKEVATRKMILLK